MSAREKPVAMPCPDCGQPNRSENECCDECTRRGQELAGIACVVGGPYNALRVQEFRREIAGVPAKHQPILLRAFIATFALPGDASLERQHIEEALSCLAQEWSV